MSVTPRLVVALVLIGAGVVVMGLAAGWWVALGAFLLVWGNNAALGGYE